MCPQHHVRITYGGQLVPEWHLKIASPVHQVAPDVAIPELIRHAHTNFEVRLESRRAPDVWMFSRMMRMHLAQHGASKCLTHINVLSFDSAPQIG